MPIKKEKIYALNQKIIFIFDAESYLKGIAPQNAEIRTVANRYL